MTSHSTAPSDQRTAVITGAASERGIGRASALRFAKQGWAVAILDLDGEAAQKCAAQIAAETGTATLGLASDVTSKESVSAAADEIRRSDLPPVGALANIAGMPSTTSFLDVDIHLWRKVIDVNLTGTFIVSQAFLPDMMDGGYGRIVNMSSVSAQSGGGVFSKTPYSAAKAGLLGFTRSLAREVAESGITVNAVSPGAVDTDIRAGDTDPEKEAQITSAVPMKRQATPDEVAALIVWLCGTDAGYITGGTHNINGGSYFSG